MIARRTFITGLGSAAGSSVIWPLAARAQQGALRKVAVVLGFAQGDPEGKIRLAAFVDTLSRLGWGEGRNVRLEVYWAGGDLTRYRSIAMEVIATSPDVIAAMTNPFVTQLNLLKTTIPIVFVQVSDSVGAGFVSNITRPGRNITGFENYQPEIGGKWLELLKEAAPATRRVGVMLQPENSSLAAVRKAIEAVAPSFDVQLTTLAVHSRAEIETAIATLAERPSGALIILASPVTIENRDLIIGLAAQHRLPAIYMFRYFVESGGLMAYGTNQLEQWRGAAQYVDRILKGEKPADLPVQAPTKYETVLNLKTAKALGLTVPPALLVAADEVIE